MGYLNNSVVTIDAILTTKGRELLAANNSLPFVVKIASIVITELFKYPICVCYYML